MMKSALFLETSGAESIIVLCEHVRLSGFKSCIDEDKFIFEHQFWITCNECGLMQEVRLMLEG